MVYKYVIFVNKSIKVNDSLMTAANDSSPLRVDSSPHERFPAQLASWTMQHTHLSLPMRGPDELRQPSSRPAKQWTREKKWSVWTKLLLEPVWDS
jgi:hypothetical protein